MCAIAAGGDLLRATRERGAVDYRRYGRESNGHGLCARARHLFAGTVARVVRGYARGASGRRPHLRATLARRRTVASGATRRTVAARAFVSQPQCIGFWSGRFPADHDAFGDDGRAGAHDDRRICARGRQCPSRSVRRRRVACREWLPFSPVLFPQHEPTHRCVRRLDRAPGAFPVRRARRDRGRDRLAARRHPVESIPAR